MKRFLARTLLLFSLSFPQLALPFTSDEIKLLEQQVNQNPIGDRIAFWAEQFIGTPYDKDPLGDYVRQTLIVADERVDCMYLTFRSVELALSNSPDEAIERALTMRFRAKGVVNDGKVVNYEDRYQDGIEMIRSGKYGTDITNRIGKTNRIMFPALETPMDFLAPPEIEKGLDKLETGDIVYFVRDPAKVSGGLIAHMGILKVESGSGASTRNVYLIHASGTKNRGGSVKKVVFREYLSHMPHIGARVSRMSE